MNASRLVPVIAGSLALAGLLTSAAMAQDTARLRPSVLQKPPVPGADADLFERSALPEPVDSQEVFLDALGAIAIVSEKGPIPGELKLIEALEKFTGRPLTGATFPAIAETIVHHYEQRDRPVVDVWFPEQDITSGVLQVHVEEGRFGEISLSGGARLNRERIASDIRVRPLQVVSESAIQSELDWLNVNPFHQATVDISEGGDGSAQLTFELSDSRPLRWFSGYENSGVELLGEDRWFVGVAMGNLFNVGHQLSYQFFTGDRYEAFHAHALTYRAPLPWRHLITVRGAIVESNVGPDVNVSGGAGTSRGESWLAAIDYRVPFARWHRIKHSAALGFEFKSSNNDFEFGGDDALDSPAEVAQITFDYDAERRVERATTVLNIGFTWSPGGVSGLNNDEAFSGTRGGAGSSYGIVRGGIEHSHLLPDGFEFGLRARGQWSADATLIPSEEFAPGGYDAVRGYDERSILGDAGYVVSGELFTPAIVLPADSSLRMLVFSDFGAALNANAASHDPSSTELSSYGVGLRFQVARNLAFRFDYGWQFETDESRGHIGIAVSF